MENNTAHKTIKYFLIGLIIFLAVIRFAALDIDPPYFFAGYTQAHLTDPYHLTFAARNAVLFDDWNPFDYHRWDIFKYSLVSGASYIVFSIFGVSRVTANIAGLLLNMGGLLLFIMSFAGYRHLRERGILTALLLINSMLLFYGRLPFLENGLIFLSGLIFFIFMRYHGKGWGLLLTGFLVAVAALAGKLFGLILLAPIILGLIYIHRSKALKPGLITLAGTAAGIIIYTLVFYGGSFSVMLDYYAEQTTGMYGAPLGLQSPLGFLRQLVTYGEAGGLFVFLPFMTILTGVGLVLFFFAIKNVKEFDKNILPLIFCAAWLICGFLGLMPFNYRPLRYTLFLFLPAAAMQAYLFGLLAEKKTLLANENRLISIPIMFFCGWYIIMQIISWVGSVGDMTIRGESAMLISGLIALVISAIKIIGFGKRMRHITRSMLAIILIPLALGIVAKQGSLIYQGLVYPDTYLKDINREISQLVDENAVLTGPFAPAFTIDNNLKGVIHVFGLANVEKDLFTKFPITHLLADRSNLDIAKKMFPSLGSAMILRRFRVRDAGLDLIRIPGTPAKMTLYEQGAAAYAQKNYDSMYIYSERFAEKYPDNLSGQNAFFFALLVTRQDDRLITEFRNFGDKHADNFRAQLICKEFADLLYRGTNDPVYQFMSDEYHRHAVEINPTLE